MNIWIIAGLSWFATSILIAWVLGAILKDHSQPILESTSVEKEKSYDC